MLLIKGPYSPCSRISAAPGSRLEDDVRLTRDEKGNCIYKKVGDIDVPKNINSYKSGCSLSAVLERCGLMPVEDKVRYLQQNPNGVSADVSNMPTNGTDAFIMLQKYRREYPDIFERIAKGESFDAVVRDVFSEKNIDDTKNVVKEDNDNVQA